MITLAALVLSATSVALSWTPTSGTLILQRCAAVCQDFALPRNTSSWVDTAAPSGTTLRYQLTAKLKGKSLKSNIVTVTTPLGVLEIREYPNVSLEQEPVVSIRGNVAFSKGADVTQVYLPTAAFTRRDGIDPAIDPWHAYGADGVAWYVSMALLAQPDGSRWGGLWVAKSQDDGLSWAAVRPAAQFGDPVRLPDGTTAKLCNVAPDYPKIASADGVVHVTAWAQLEPCTSGSWALLFARSADQGVTWTRQTLAGLKTIEQLVAVGGDLYALNRPDGLARSADRGLTWEILRPWLSKDPLPIRSAIAVEPGGSLVLVWAAWTDQVSTLWLSRSTDRGETWSVPERIDDGADGVARGEQLALAASPTGRLDLLWTRGDTMWYSWRPPGSQLWQHRQVGASGIYHLAHKRDYIGLAASGQIAVGVYAVAPASGDTGGRLLIVRHP